MSQVTGKNVVLYQYVPNPYDINFSIVDNGDGSQTVTFTWASTPPGATAVKLGYNDGTWHDNTASATSPGTLVLPLGDYNYRFSFLALSGIQTYDLPVVDWEPYACARAVSINVTTDLIETSVSGSGIWRTFKPTANSWTASIEGVVKLLEEGMLSIEDLRAKQFAQEKIYIKYQRVDDDGNEYSEYGYAYIASSQDTGSYNDMDTFSIELTGTGALQQSES